MLKNLLFREYQYRILLNPLILYGSKFIGQELSEIKREIPIIVSLCSKEENLRETEIALYSLFTQSILPNKIILWLDNELQLADLPYEITRLIKYGLDIRFTNDIFFTSTINTLKEFSNSIVVTASDNIFYPKDWLEKLYHSYISNPQDIHAHLTKQIKTTELKILPYKTWKKNPEESSKYENFFILESGVLFPPKCFIDEVFRKDIYTKISSLNLWLWFMAVLSNKKIRVVKNHQQCLTVINIFNKKYTVVENYDDQIETILNYYKHNIFYKLNLHL